MLFRQKQTVLEREWESLKKKEKRFEEKQMQKSSSPVYKKLDEIIPEKLRSTLNIAFNKAFELVFEKGTAIIEKTYNKEQKELDYQVNEYAAELKETKKTIRAFSNQANKSKAVNLLLTGVEGVGLGALGIGIPDIPLFIGVLLKSIYEIALSYGFSYETESEQCFILKLIQVSMEHGETFKEGNEEIDKLIENGVVFSDIRKEQIKDTSSTMANELLYMKFLQGIPIIGIAGGLSDSIYLKKVTDFVQLKYKKRFLLNRDKIK